MVYADSIEDPEMLENTIVGDLRDGQMIENSVISGVPTRVGDDGGELTENSNEMGLISSYADVDLEPHEGMEFESEEAAKAFYDAYARRVGFVTRVSAYCRSKIDGAIISRRLVCNKEGFKKGKVKRPMAVTREGCKAMINIKRQKPGKWIISKFEKEHNHPLLISSKIRRGSLQNRSAEDAKKIRELSYALQRANRRCAAYREHLDTILKDIEEHTNHLSDKVQGIVHSVTELESQELEEHSHHRRLQS
ncbi:FAR1 DNA binding domain [Macleaya cordata]|uniref:FAR1 DNA binding domain n=1 Tax=Macleaya cordata TaxID=56857 RepID=A0A200Q2A7_MACCD|nr:FAR1 DNA binding domain [Macleaya cordata]